MLRFLVFILLPFVARAECPRQLYLDLFETLDADNDGKYSIEECGVIFMAVDENKDGIITLEEMDREDPELDPIFHGNAATFFKLFDLDNDGVLSQIDVFLNFDLVDTNLDDFWGRDEHKERVDDYCEAEEA
ncbi:hypothetical protein BsWGS_07046 [Bradybaena similaris]